MRMKSQSKAQNTSRVEPTLSTATTKNCPTSGNHNPFRLICSGQSGAPSRSVKLNFWPKRASLHRKLS